MVGIDLAAYSIDGVSVGEPMPCSNLDRAGVETETDGMSLGSVFVTVDEYQGEFFRKGETIELDSTASPTDIEQLFGQPYWKDASDEELILFYEYQAGTIELQFEFSDSKSLGYITIANNGIMSDPEQRKSYGVDKPWPPAE